MDASDAGNDAGADSAPACVDADGDGYGIGAGCAKLDCDDGNPLVNPGMQELADDGLDSDCSGGDLKAAAGPGYYVDGASASCTDSAAGRGSKATPYCSIEKAVLDSYQTLPVTSEGQAFFVAKGTYPLVIGFPKSIRLYGGYDSAAWTWDPVANETVIGGNDHLDNSDGQTCRSGPGCSAQCVCVDYDSWVSINADANPERTTLRRRPCASETIGDARLATFAHGGTKRVVVEQPHEAIHEVLEVDGDLLREHVRAVRVGSEPPEPRSDARRVRPVRRNQEPFDAVIDEIAIAIPVRRHDGASGRHRFDDTEPERLLEVVDRRAEDRGVPIQRRPFRFRDVGRDAHVVIEPELADARRVDVDGGRVSDAGEHEQRATSSA